MASYFDARKSLLKEAPKRFFYLCGPSVVLRERLVDAIKASVSPAPEDYESLTVGENSTHDIWAALNQYHYQRTLVPGQDTEQPTRLIVVRDAQLLTDYTYLLDWIENAVGRKLMPNVTAVFVSNDDAWDEEKFPDARERISKSGMYVRCVTPQHDRAVELVRAESDGKLSEATAKYLLQRVGMDLGLAFDCLNKARYFKGELSDKTINVLSTPKLSEEFTTYLMKQQKDAAYAAASLLPVSEYSRVVGFLEYKLEAVTKLHEAIQSTDGTYRAALLKSRLPPPVVASLFYVAKYYGAEAVQRKTEVLAFADAAVHSSNTDNVLEILVTLW